MLPAPTQLRVERVEDLAVDPPDREFSEERLDVQAGEALVAGARRLLHLKHLEVAVHQLRDGGVRPRAPSLVNLGQEAGPGPLSFFGRGLACGDDLGQVVTFARNRIDAGVDPDPQRAARESLDLTAVSATSRGASGRRDSRLAAISLHVWLHDGSLWMLRKPVTWCPRQDSNLRRTV